MEILALIPAHNEAARLEPVVLAACGHLPVLVVDDGSTDATSAVGLAAGAEVLRQEPNRGKGEALKTGFRRALELSAEAVITLDADGQHDPAEIPAFLTAYTSHHPDLIIGARDYNLMPMRRRLPNTFGRFVFSWAVGQRIPDNQSGYRLISRRLIEAALQSRHGGFEFEVDMIVICIQKNFLMDWVPIRTIYSGETSHISPIKHAWRFIVLAWRTYLAMRRK